MLLVLALAVLPADAGELSQRDLRLYRDAFAALERNRWDEARRLAAQAHEPLPARVIHWLDLMRPDRRADFAEIARFLGDHPGWPNQTGLRERAELAMPTTLPPKQVRAWFATFPPVSTPGVIRLADALMALGATDEATQRVRRHWIEGTLGRGEEQDFRLRYRALLRPEDHRARLDRLLWTGEAAAARRMLPLVDAGQRALAEARLALAALAPGVDARIARVPRHLRDDPGLIYERVRWRRRKDRDESAIALLAALPATVTQNRAWWTERHILARRAMERGQSRRAYELAAAHGLSAGFAFAQAEFLAGWLALRFLNQPETALAHFQRLHDGVGTPISRARAAYWLGRTRQTLGRTGEAERWYRQAAAHNTTFYGLLAAGRLGTAPPVLAPALPVTAQSVQAFERDERVRLVRLLHEIDAESRYGALFLRQLGREARTPSAYALVARLARQVGQTAVAVAIAKQAVQDGITLAEPAYPLLDIDLPGRLEPALLHAVIRQESTFDRTVISPAGARGLMQLMPTTARYVATRLGVDHSHHRLTQDPAYNIRLGSAYLQELLDRFNGSYVLAVAAYNAGPARVQEWLRLFGDPRAEGVDIIDWIELIPIYETRNYVQRVMEALHVYRARLDGGNFNGTLEQDLRR